MENNIEVLIAPGFNGIEWNLLLLKKALPMTKRESVQYLRRASDIVARIGNPR